MDLGPDGVQIRVYSPMKTVADCFKYADKVGAETGPVALAASVVSNYSVSPRSAGSSRPY